MKDGEENKKDNERRGSLGVLRRVLLKVWYEVTGWVYCPLFQGLFVSIVIVLLWPDKCFPAVSFGAVDEFP